MTRFWGVFIISMLLAVDGRAESEWVEAIDVLYEKPTSSAFHIELADRFQMAALETRVGTHCRVRLQPMFVVRSEPRTMSSSTLLWEPSATLPLQSVRSEWVGSQLLIELSFQREVSCTFQVSSSHRQIWISIENSNIKVSSEIRTLLEQARSALITGENEKAIQLYRQIIALPSHPLQQEALEYLGVALERQGDFERAAQVYQTYLDQFPEAAGASRVQQRLQGLRLMVATPPAPLRKSVKDPQAETLHWFGVISNAYQHYATELPDSGWESLQSNWITDLNLNGRMRSEAADLKILLSAGYQHDFEEDNDEPERLSYAYVDYRHHATGQEVRFGRQTTNGEGILGRYDGAHYHKDLGSRFGINGILGLPVYSSRDLELNSDAQLYGASIDYAAPDSPWRSNVFLAYQTVNGLTDRQAVGGEINYLTQQMNVLTYVDFDVYFNEINTVMLNGNWYGEDESHYYVTLDYRRSPTLTLSNALIGQGIDNIDWLVDTGLSEGELEEVALDRSAISQTLSAGASRRFHPKFRWALDTSLWELSATDESLGVPGFEGTDTEYNISGQLMGNDLLAERDLLWLTLRWAELTNSQLVSVILDWRVPISEKWRIRPKLQVYQRNFSDTDSQQQSITPRIRVEYWPAKQWLMEMDLAAEWMTLEQEQISTDQTNLYFYLRAEWQF